MTNKELVRRVKLLSSIFTNSTKQLTATLLGFETFTIVEKERILRELDTYLKTLTDKSNSWYETNLKSAYKDGAHDVMDYLKNLGVQNIIYTKDDYDIMSQLIDSSQRFTQEAISGVKRSSSKVLDEFTIKRLQQMISDDVKDSVSLRQLKGELLEYLQKKGVTIKDSTGRRWQLDKYAEMMARTDMMNSYNQGVANQILHRKGDLAYITSYAGCKCDVCLKWEGQVVSISGTDPKYPKLDDAYADGVFHPNCKHRLRPYLEEFTEKKEKNDLFGDIYETQMKGLESEGYNRKYMESI